MNINHKRRWLQYSLRTIFIVVTLLCVALAITARNYHTRRAAIRAIDELGGSYGVELLGPEWLRNLVGDDKYFYNALRISLGRPDSPYQAERPFNDQELAGMVDQINVFRGARYLDLQGSPITDEGLRCLVRVRDLEILQLESTAVTDAGLVYLEPITTLKEVRLTGTKVSDEGVAKLQRNIPKCTVEYRAPPPKP
ncbi:MAG TPA: hypothetical protein VGJ26_11635 [Pirellulales bacterium]